MECVIVIPTKKYLGFIDLIERLNPTLNVKILIFGEINCDINNIYHQKNILYLNEDELTVNLLKINENTNGWSLEFNLQEYKNNSFFYNSYINFIKELKTLINPILEFNTKNIKEVFLKHLNFKLKYSSSSFENFNILYYIKNLEDIHQFYKDQSILKLMYKKLLHTHNENFLKIFYPNLSKFLNFDKIQPPLELKKNHFIKKRKRKSSKIKIMTNLYN